MVDAPEGANSCRWGGADKATHGGIRDVSPPEPRLKFKQEHEFWRHECLFAQREAVTIVIGCSGSDCHCWASISATSNVLSLGMPSIQSSSMESLCFSRC